ncbi:hypothetical protein PIB30_098375 [Stylosanthes scabra]|uniref:Uncharacterized protein n=1 Tax=Stylosanthes scabra TaxID=79078 RepID=A0ABU6UXP6_9FABA|nr:hypothetical protein [Stylosanthes scabra]
MSRPLRGISLTRRDLLSLQESFWDFQFHHPANLSAGWAKDKITKIYLGKAAKKTENYASSAEQKDKKYNGDDVEVLRSERKERHGGAKARASYTAKDVKDIWALLSAITTICVDDIISSR